MSYYTACNAPIKRPYDRGTVLCTRREGHDGEHSITFDSGRVEWRWKTGDTRPRVTITGEGS